MSPNLKPNKCPANLTGDCGECPWFKGLCDYPYIGAVKMPITQKKETKDE